MNSKIAIPTITFALALAAQVALAATPNAAMPSDGLSEKAKRLLTLRGATVIVSTDAAQLRRIADEQAASVTEVPWLSSLDVDGSRLKLAPRGWIPVLAQVIGSPDITAKPMWVRQQDVVVGDAFKRVTSCWPIKKLEIEAGDSAAGFRFAPDGSGTFGISFDESRPREKTSGQIHVYIDKNILMLKSADSRAPKFPMLGIKLPENQVFVYGAPANESIAFDPKDLRDCTAIGVEGGK